MLLRKEKEILEEKILSPFAQKSKDSLGREAPEKKCKYRTDFQRDRDRIIHSKAFRRLMHKTQVFLIPDGDHFRTRLTHTLEVSGIARTIASSLSLNEDLTEAIALGHDLGHTPFGHAGETVLREIFQKNFSHNVQSLRIVTTLEMRKKKRGLNLTAEVKEGILGHTGSSVPKTLEGQIVRIADRIAYINHDIEDAIRGGIIKENSLPKKYTNILGKTKSNRISTLVSDMISESDGKNKIYQSKKIFEAMMGLREFMHKEVYMNDLVRKAGEASRVKTIISSLFNYYKNNPSEISDEYKDLIKKDGISELSKDMVAGMTDRFSVKKYEELFLPKNL